MKKVYIVAALAAIAVVVFALILGAQISASNKIDKAEVEVMVAVTDIKAGTTITPDMVQLARINNKAVLPNVYTNGDCIGLIANTNIFAQEQITMNKVVSKESLSYNRLSYKLEEGYRAISIAVDNTTSVSGFIRSGDLADILYTVQTNKATKNGMYEAATEVLFEKCKVIAVGTYAANQNGSASDYATITLAMPTEDAMKLASYVYSIANGSTGTGNSEEENNDETKKDVGGIGGRLSLVLRNPDDETSISAVITNIN